MKKPNTLLIHYGEMILKGKNRGFFERQLIENIKNAFRRDNITDFSLEKKYGKILVRFKKEFDENKISDSLLSVFGIANFSFAFEVPLESKSIADSSLFFALKSKASSFRISSSRSNKSFSKTSEELNREIGAIVVEKTGKAVQLINPPLEIYIHIMEQSALVFVGKIKTIGGMPVGTSGKALVMLSGGIDSPVAAYLSLKRGLSTRFIHFHSIPYTSKESVEKVKKLASILKRYGSTEKIYLVPFADAQKDIIMKVPDKYRIIFYRRLMLKIAQTIAKQENAKTIITGDALAQVASQTIENMATISQASDMLILRPLISMDKEDIMQLAKQIGTYDTSIMPHDDCCSRLMPKNPETKADLHKILELEKNIDVEKIVSDAIRSTVTS